MSDFSLSLTVPFKGELRFTNNKVILMSKDRNEILYIGGLLSNMNTAIGDLGYNSLLLYSTTAGPVYYRITMSMKNIRKVYSTGYYVTIEPDLA